MKNVTKAGLIPVVAAGWTVAHQEQLTRNSIPLAVQPLPPSVLLCLSEVHPAAGKIRSRLKFKQGNFQKMKYTKKPCIRVMNKGDYQKSKFQNAQF